MNFNILTDSCFWIALYDPAHNLSLAEEAERMADEISNENIIIPFPTLYEFVNSRLSRREVRQQFESILKKSNVILLNDEKYIFEALENFFKKSEQSYNDISLVDEVLKLIIEDKNLKIDYLASFDEGLLKSANARGVKTV